MDNVIAAIDGETRTSEVRRSAGNNTRTNVEPTVFRRTVLKRVPLSISAGFPMESTEVAETPIHYALSSE
jgi:hypothetical protein